MGKLICLDHFRPQQRDLPPNAMCGGMVAPYVVNPSAPPPPRKPPITALLLQEFVELARHNPDLFDGLPDIASMHNEDKVATLLALPIETRKRLRAALRSWLDKKYPRPTAKMDRLPLGS